jgi:glucosamine--fructose-6-phosphate aminotransferase (isomerizing)
VFVTQTDTEVIAHLVDRHYDGDLLEAVQRTVPRLRGAFAIAVFCRDEPHRVVGARQGSPLILGVGSPPARSETFLASDAMALAGVTDQIVYLEEGDVADIQLGKHWIAHADAEGTWRNVVRPVKTVVAHSGAAELGTLPATTCRRRSSSSRGRSPTRSMRCRHLARAVRRRRLPGASRRSSRC